MRARDRILGIVLGLALGVGIVAAFVFLGSEGTIDDASLGGQHAPRHGDGGGGGGKPPAQPRTATVEIVGGAPPDSGPARLDYAEGDRVRLRLVADSAVDVELLGYGIAKSVPASGSATIEFTASRPGNFALIVTASHIAVAQIRVGTPPAP
jgi:hypothetical protein